MPVTYLFQDEWEKYFTVVQFDQRLAGKTYFANNQKTALQEDSIDLRVSDVIEMTQYLKKRFSKKKIALLGHSWGSVLGINTIKKHPDLFSVYVGVGQVVNFIQAEKIGYKKTLELVTAAKNDQDMKSLHSLAPYPEIVNNKYYDSIGQDMMKLRYLQGKYGIGMPVRYIDNLPVILSPYYSIADLRYYLTDVFKANKAVMKYLVEDYDLRNMGLDYKIPMIFIMGDNDWTTPTQLMKSIYPEISSPVKELHIIVNAGHNTMVDNTNDFLDVLIKRVYPLALRQ